MAWGVTGNTHLTSRVRVSVSPSAQTALPQTTEIAMKKLLFAFVLAVALLAGVGGYLYHSEDATPRESDLAKYPEIAVFLAGRTGFRGIRFNLDTNYYSFAFPTTLSSDETYFNAIHAPALSKGWQLTATEPRRRVYRRTDTRSIGWTHGEEITLIYDAAKPEVTVVWRQDPEHSGG
jgi:hypothetical protein